MNISIKFTAADVKEYSSVDVSQLPTEELNKITAGVVSDFSDSSLLKQIVDSRAQKVLDAYLANSNTA